MGDAYCPIHGTVSDLHDCRPLSHRPQAYQPIIDPGPSRRERIATAALQGLLGSSARNANRFGEATELLVWAPGVAAKQAVALADALIAELDGE